MRNIPSRIFLATACCFTMVFGLIALPSASAQLTETTEVLETGETLITTTLITDGGNTSVVTERLVAADGCSETVTTTTGTVVGDTEPLIPLQEYEGRQNSAPAVTQAFVTTVTEEENELDCVPPESTEDNPDEVLGEVVLAVTGSDIDVPIAVGAVLIGSGGLLVAASKRRRSNKS